MVDACDGVSLLLRYLLLYSAHSLVRLDKVRLDGEGFCAGLRAVRSIEAGQVLLTTCSSMASDAAAADLGRLSVIRPTSSSAGRPCDRLILGPFRFANHDCRPNAQVRSRRVSSG